MTVSRIFSDTVGYNHPKAKGEETEESQKVVVNSLENCPVKGDDLQ